MSSSFLGTGDAPPTLPPPSPAYVRPPKSPGLALLLSLFPGLGQVYNGQPSKAFVFFFSWVGSIYGTARIDPFPFAFLIPFVYFYGLVDAYRSSTLINALAAGGLRPPEESTAESPTWGLVLILLGAVLLLNNLGWISLHRLRDFWPLGLIVAGAVFLRNSLRRPKGEGVGRD